MISSFEIIKNTLPIVVCLQCTFWGYWWFENRKSYDDTFLLYLRKIFYEFQVC